MMDFLRRQLFLIVCGIFAVAGITMTVLGMVSMGEVKKEMGKFISNAKSLGQAARAPSGSDTVINSKAIAIQKNKIADIERNYKEILERVSALNQWTPLVPGAFPEPESREPKTMFKAAYPEAFDALLKQLGGGTGPTTEQIIQVQVLIENERQVPQIQVDNGGSAAPKDSPAPEKYYTEAGVPLEPAARRVATIRASIANAHHIRCYATRDAFDIHAKITNPQILVPDVADMWDAQTSLWIQQDVVEALARINDAAAAEIEAADGQAWVGVLPVKELISIRTSWYVSEGDPAREVSEPGGEQAAFPPESPDRSFTHRATSEDMYEVMHFSVKLVVDVRDLPAIMGEICRDRFHTVLRVSYEAEPPNIDMVQKIYGSEPVVNVIIDFETTMFGDLYRPLMPDLILDYLGLPEREV